MEQWMLGGAANATISIAYLIIALFIFWGLRASPGHWRNNPLALATGAIFFTCSVGHGTHAYHVFAPLVGLADPSAEAARVQFADWHVWAWDGTTAVVGVWYLSLRNRFPALVRGGAMFEDLRIRRMQALQIHDDVVQKLAQAKLALDLDRRDEAYARIEETLGAARAIITDLLGPVGSEIELGPGDLRREGG